MILLLFCTHSSLGEKLDIYSCAGARLYSASEKLLEFFGAAVSRGKEHCSVYRMDDHNSDNTRNAFCVQQWRKERARKPDLPTMASKWIWKEPFIIHFWRNNFHIHLKASFSYFFCFIFILCIQLYENVFNYINMYSIKTKCIQLKQNVSNYNKMNSIASKMYSNTSRCFWYNFLSSLLGHCDCCDKGHDL